MRSNPFIRNIRQPQSSMSIQPRQTPKQLPFHQQDNRKVQRQKTVKQEKFIWILGESIGENNIVLNFPLNILVGQKNKFLEISCMRLQMNQFKQTDYPDYIGLYWRNMDGYLNNANTSTHLISVAYPSSSINYGISEGTVNSHKNILYQNNSETLWDVTGINNLSLSIVTSDNPETPLTLPLTNPVVVEGKIIRFIE